MTATKKAPTFVECVLVAASVAANNILCDYWSVDEMRRCLDRFVKNEIFQSDIPPKTNKRFFPRLKTIRSHMVEALRKVRYSKIDQECLSKKIEQWKFENSSDRIYFQPKGTAESTSGLYKNIFFLNWN